MTVIDHSIVINAPIERVFELLDEPSRLPDYVPGVRRIDEIRRSDQRIGDSFRAHYAVLGLELPIAFTTIEYAKPRTIVLQMDGALIGTYALTLKPEGRSTGVNLRVQYHMKGGILGQAMDSLVVERLNEKNAEHFLENLKIISEAPTA
jgi:carbon monoxide dehydrogenase subunit G